VCLLFADPIGSGHHQMPVVMVQGLACVRDSDLQANTDGGFNRCAQVTRRASLMVS